MAKDGLASTDELLRQELVREIDDLVLRGTSFIRIDGTPGTGKTPLMEFYRRRLQTVGSTGTLLHRLAHFESEDDPKGAELAQMLHGRLDQAGLRIVPYHRLRHECDSALPATVVESLSTQIEAAVPQARLPQYAKSLHRLSAALDCASSMLTAEKTRLVLLIDGIDRFEGDGATVGTLADILPVALPAVSVICSMRPVHDDLGFMEAGSFARLDLDDTASKIAACRRLAAALLPRVPVAIDIEHAIAAAHGNPRYLRDLLSMLIERPRAPLDRVPYGYRAYLEQLWDDISATDPTDRDALLTGLGIVCRAAVPMTIGDIAENAGWAGQGDPRCTAFLRRARAFLVETGPKPSKYAPFVPAFAEFVRRKLAEELGEASGPIAVATSGVRGPEDGSLSPERAKPTYVTGRTSTWYALLVGIDQFVESELSLKYCVNDVQALGAALCQLGYAVSTLDDQQPDLRLRPTLLNIRAALAGLEGRVDPDALLWVHFSTHGMLVGGRPVVLAADSRTVDVEASALPIETILAFMRASGARRRFLSLDACHSGVELGRDAGAERVGLDPAFVRHAFELAEGEYVFSSCTASQDAQDWAQRQLGVCTAFMVDGLAGKADPLGSGIITADQLRDYVVASVRGWTFSHQKQLQLPTAESRVDGELILADRRSSAQPRA